MLQIGICDDNELDRTALRGELCRLSNYCSAGDLRFFEYGSAEQLLFHVEDDLDGLDVLFLDIYMSGLNGMEAAHKLRRLGMRTPIVFLTTSPDFALESYDVAAFGYLIKPVDNLRLAELMAKLETQRKTQKYYIYRKGTGVRKVPHDEIVFAESRDHLLLIHLESGELLEGVGRVDELEAALADPRFLRTHKSYLVNMSHVARAGETFILDGGQSVPIRKKDRKAICDQYHRWLIKEAF